MMTNLQELQEDLADAQFASNVRAAVLDLIAAAVRNGVIVLACMLLNRHRSHISGGACMRCGRFW